VTQLIGVSETLLITLYCRYLETQRPDAIIKDEKAIELVEKIDYDFSKFHDWTVQYGVAVRTEMRFLAGNTQFHHPVARTNRLHSVF